MRSVQNNGTVATGVDLTIRAVAEAVAEFREQLSQQLVRV